MDMLKDVHHTAARSKKLVSELQHLKTAIHAMEHDTRHMHDVSVDQR